LRTGGLDSDGTSTSSMTWVRKVALARISTSRNREDDCGTSFASASRRWTRQGVNGSSTGRANRNRQGSVFAQRQASPPAGAGRRPRTWSRRSIAARSGSRCAAVQGSRAVVTRTIGWSPPANPSSSATDQPIASVRTTNASAGRPRAFRRSRRPCPIASGSGSSAPAMTITRTAPSGIGSRSAARSSGWIQSSPSSGGGPSSGGRGLMRGSREGPASAPARPDKRPGGDGQPAPASPRRSAGRRGRRSAGPRSWSRPGTPRRPRRNRPG